MPLTVNCHSPPMPSLFSKQVGSSPSSRQHLMEASPLTPAPTIATLRTMTQSGVWKETSRHTYFYRRKLAIQGKCKGHASCKSQECCISWYFPIPVTVPRCLYLSILVVKLAKQQCSLWRVWVLCISHCYQAFWLFPPPRMFTLLTVTEQHTSINYETEA